MRGKGRRIIQEDPRNGIGSIRGRHQEGTRFPKVRPDPFRRKPPETGCFRRVFRYDQIIPLKKIDSVCPIRIQNILPFSRHNTMKPPIIVKSLLWD
jgi:hypothetical protein